MMITVLVLLFSLFFCIYPQQEIYTHSLPSNSFPIWTTTPSNRVFLDSPIPSYSENAIKLYCARNEYEPFVVIVQTTFPLTISTPNFGNGITSELSQVRYVNIETKTDNLGQEGPYPDVIYPRSFDTVINDVTINSNENTAFWITIHVSSSVQGGDYIATMDLNNEQITINLHIFDFDVPSTLNVKSQMNFNFEAVLQKYSVTGTGDDYWKYVDKIKKFFLGHRVTPKSPLWPGGLTSNGGACFIDYDCNAGTLSDPYGIWGFYELADTCLVNGYEGARFPSYMFATFKNNYASDDQRPETFCGVTRHSSDWLGSAGTQYNRAWFKYMKTIQDELEEMELLDKAYYYIANEPQDQDDYDAVAWYSEQLHRFAPGLKLMVSEEPKKEIFANKKYRAKIDIWLPVLHVFSNDLIKLIYQRKYYCGEQTWMYFLHGTRPPFFNPITLDHPGIESKLTGWFLFKYRLEGIAYYSMNNWGTNPYTNPATDDHNGDTFMLYPPEFGTTNNIDYGANNHRLVSSVRFELMRDSLEDYEYLYLLNKGKPKVTKQKTLADKIASKIILGVKSYQRNDEFMYNLRRVIGLYLGGEVNEDALDIHAPPPHSRGNEDPSNYYINFQEVNGEPLDNPLIVDGNTFMKIGWNQYDSSLGYGWYGQLDWTLYAYNGNGNELQKSYIYCDYGREKTFVFILPNGCYDVEVSVGRSTSNDAHNRIFINSIAFIDDEPNNNGYLVRENEICVTDYTLSMDMGIFNEYTMLNYLKIESNGRTGDTGVETFKYKTSNIDCPRDLETLIITSVIVGICLSCFFICIIIVVTVGMFLYVYKETIKSSIKK